MCPRLRVLTGSSSDFNDADYPAEDARVSPSWLFANANSEAARDILASSNNNARADPHLVDREILSASAEGGQLARLS